MPPKRRTPSAEPPRRLVLRNHWSPGDIVMLTAAVRDLHRRHPGRFVTDVRTSCPALWEHNPHVTALDETDPGVEVIECEYPLIHQSNARPLHCLNGFADFLSQRLGVPCPLTEPRGDLHLSPEEKAEPGLVERCLGRRVPYWILVAGGKYDYTIKWWDRDRYQAVVDAFRDRLLFVQVGDASHHHPRLDGVFDFRGRTDLRDLVKLVHYSAGVVCPVTSLMHLAAAVECPAGGPRHRPCVVVAGGREPPTWEAYPGHQFVHTVGALPCCAHGGCWRARTFPQRDGDAERDAPSRICLDVVDGLPRCMDLIPAAEIVRRLELYLGNGMARTLTPAEARLARPALNPPRKRARARRTNGGSPAVTICLVVSAGAGGTGRRAIESIHRHCRRGDYRLRVIAAGLPDGARRGLLRLQARGIIDRLHLAPAPLDRTTLVHRLLRDPVPTEFVWLLDATAPVRGRHTLPGRIARARRARGPTVLWGNPVAVPATTGEATEVREWAQRAPWYRGRRTRSTPTVRAAPGSGTSLDPRDWFARAAALRAIDWPDPGLPGHLHEPLLAEAIRQQGWRIETIADGLIPRVD